MRVFSNLQRFVRVLRVGLACFAVAALFGGTTADAKEAPAAKRAASLLASGKAAEALAASYEALAAAPDDGATLRGRLGVVVQDMAATISDLRIAH